MEKQFDTTLEWKNHNDFFRDLNELLTEITKVEILIYADIMQIYTYYAMISALRTKHNCYLKDNENIKARLKNIRSGLYDSEVLKQIQKRPNDKMLVSHLIKIYDGLTDIYEEMVGNFQSNELLPKTQKIDNNSPGALRNIK